MHAFGASKIMTQRKFWMDEWNEWKKKKKKRKKIFSHVNPFVELSAFFGVTLLFFFFFFQGNKYCREILNE